MTDEFALLNARKLANTVRFFEDKHDTSLGLQPSSLHEVVDEFYRTAVEISEDLTPQLEDAIVSVCGRLKLDRLSINAFVHSSHDLQAACYYTDTKKCLVRFSSALVNLLSAEELQFVIAHELGHFLLQHAPNATSVNTSEFFVFQRAKEISADRIGLVGCGSLEVAARTLIKTASGLKSDYLKVNLGHYLKQIDQINKPDLGENPFNTHPSMLIRAYSLNLFGERKLTLGYSDFDQTEVYEKDKILRTHLDKYVDQVLIDRMKSAKDDLEMWVAARIVIEDGRFDKDEQRIFEARFGSKTLSKLKNFLSLSTESQASSEVAQKVRACKKRLENISPSEAESFIFEIERTLRMTFLSG